MKRLEVPGPRLERNVTLNMMGDWGIANLHRICGWIAAEVWFRSGPDSRFATWNGRGGRDAVEAVLDGRVDTSLFVPAPFGRTIIEGKGICDHPDRSRLRALGTLPQDDRLVFAVDASLGVRSLEDIRRKKPKLTLATAWDDGENMVGYAVTRMLDAAGMPRATIESWGGEFIEGEAPWDVMPHVISGRANAVIFEAVMTPYWKQMQEKRPMSFIPIDEDVLKALEAKYSWPRGHVPVSRFPGLERAFDTVDFSDFLLLCRDDLPEDLAHLIAWCLCETRGTIERQYRHLKPEDSPLTYPLDPRKIARTSVPLHEGARRYYQQAGVL